MARLWFAAVSGLDKRGCFHCRKPGLTRLEGKFSRTNFPCAAQGGFQYVNFDRENYVDYVCTRMGKPGAFDFQHDEISSVQTTG